MSIQTSIVIRTYNEERYLRQLLVAIDQQSVPSSARETVIVDSGSTDGTLKIADEFKTKIVNINKEEFSFGRSLNLGIENSAGQYMVMISGHCVPERKEWLANLVSPFQRDNKIGITYGRQLPGPDTFFSEKQIFAKYFPDSETPSQRDFFCNNANAAVRKDVWERFKYDEELTGLEDMHLAKRACADSLTVHYAHDAPVFHYHHETWTQVRRRFQREAIALRQIMPELHVTSLDAMRYWTAGVLSDYGTALSEKCFLSHLFSVPWYRLAQYLGSWRGHRQHRKLSKREKERYFYPK